jgi:AcrR family transcriptional regulator
MPGIREKKQARTEAVILRSAAYLISRKGLERTTVEDIAERAQVGVGTVYNYFGSKNELLVVLMERETRDLLREGESIQAHPGTAPESALTDLFWIYTKGFLTRFERRMLREVFAAAFYQPEALGKKMTRLDYELMGQVIELLRKYQQLGVIKRALPLDQAALVLYGSFAILIMMCLQYEEMSLENARQQLAASIALTFQDWKESASSPRQAINVAHEDGD